MVLFGNFFNGNALKGKDTTFKVGQKIQSKSNGSICSIKREITLNNIKHFEICIENDVAKREIILSEHEDSAWVTKNEFKNYNFAEGDSDIINLL